MKKKEEKQRSHDPKGCGDGVKTLGPVLQVFLNCSFIPCHERVQTAQGLPHPHLFSFAPEKGRAEEGEYLKQCSDREVLFLVRCTFRKCKRGKS